VPVCHRRATARRVLSALHPAAAAAAKATNARHTIRRCPDGNRSGQRGAGQANGRQWGRHSHACRKERERERGRVTRMKNDTRVSGWPEGGRCAGAANELGFRICGCFSSQEAACAGAAGTVTPACRRGHLTYFSSGPSTRLWPKKCRFSLTVAFAFPIPKVENVPIPASATFKAGGVGLRNNTLGARKPLCDHLWPSASFNRQRKGICGTAATLVSCKL
jgi:hypothetical protein